MYAECVVAACLPYVWAYAFFYQSCSVSHNAYCVKFCNSISLYHGQ